MLLELFIFHLNDIDTKFRHLRWLAYCFINYHNLAYEIETFADSHK